MADETVEEGASESENTMTFIVPGLRSVHVTLRKPNNRGRTISFSVELAKKMLNNVTHVAVSVDEKTRTLTFFPSGKVFQKQPAHKLVREGGTDSTARCLLFNVVAAECIEHVRSARYAVKIHSDRFEIRWGKP